MSCLEFQYFLGDMGWGDYCLDLDNSLIRLWNGCLEKSLVGKHGKANPPLYKSNFEWCIQCRRRTVNNTGDETLFFLHFDSIKRVVKHKNTSPFGRITNLGCFVRSGGERCRTVLDY